MPPTTVHISPTDYLNQVSDRFAKGDMRSLRKVIGELAVFWEQHFPEAKMHQQRLLLFQNQATIIIQEFDAGIHPAEINRTTMSEWANRVLIFLDGMAEYAESDDSEAAKERLIEEEMAIRKTEALKAFDELDFDSAQTQAFNLLYKLYPAPFLFVIHGNGAERGQRWLYNRLIRFNKFFYHPSALHIPIDLESKSSEAGRSGFLATLQSKLKIEKITNKAIIIEELARHLEKRNVIITFKSRYGKSVEWVLKFCDWMQQQISLKQPKSKLVFFLCMDEAFTSDFQFEQAQGMVVSEELPLICDKRFYAWLSACNGISYEPIMQKFGAIFFEDKAKHLDLCKIKLQKLKSKTDILAEFGEGIAMDDPAFPAEEFVSQITQHILELNWLECKELWLQY